jgi:hypothetical protein
MKETQKAQAASLLSSGVSVNSVAKQTGLSPKTVRVVRDKNFKGSDAAGTPEAVEVAPAKGDTPIPRTDTKTMGEVANLPFFIVSLFLGAGWELSEEERYRIGGELTNVVPRLPGPVYERIEYGMPFVKLVGLILRAVRRRLDLAASINSHRVQPQAPQPEMVTSTVAYEPTVPSPLRAENADDGRMVDESGGVVQSTRYNPFG